MGPVKQAEAPLAGSVSAPPEPRAAKPRAPSVSSAVHKVQQQRHVYQGEREWQERRSMLRGLLVLAVVLLLISLYRAGMDRAFFTGWWRQW